MGADNNCSVAAPWDCYNDRLLRPKGVRKGLGGDTFLLGLQNYVLNLGEEPFRSLCAGDSLREARVIGRVLLKVTPDVVPLELGEQTSNVLLVFELGRVRSWDCDRFDLCIELCDVEEVASATSILL